MHQWQIAGKKEADSGPPSLRVCSHHHCHPPSCCGCNQHRFTKDEQKANLILFQAWLLHTWKCRTLGLIHSSSIDLGGGTVSTAVATMLHVNGPSLLQSEPFWLVIAICRCGCRCPEWLRWQVGCHPTYMSHCGTCNTYRTAPHVTTLLIHREYTTKGASSLT